MTHRNSVLRADTGNVGMFLYIMPALDFKPGYFIHAKDQVTAIATTAYIGFV